MSKVSQHGASSVSADARSEAPDAHAALIPDASVASEAGTAATLDATAATSDAAATRAVLDAAVDAAADATTTGSDAGTTRPALDAAAEAAAADAQACVPGEGIDCCPSDPAKVAPGACGCGVADTDQDMDGVPDCNDGCANDPEKVQPGICGCGFPDMEEGCLGLRAAIVHRYTFDGTGTTAADSKGSSSGTIIHTQLDGSGALTLAGGTSDQYVDLPNNLLSVLTNATLETWIKWNGGASWQRIFDFGSSNMPEGQQGTGITYLFLTPHAANLSAGMRAAFSTNGSGAEVVVSIANQLPSGKLSHVAVVVDDQADRLLLYQDGAEIGSTAFTGHLSSISDVNCWLGRSLYSNDPELGAMLYEFRIYNAALTPAQLMTSFNAGPDATFF